MSENALQKTYKNNPHSRVFYIVTVTKKMFLFKTLGEQAPKAYELNIKHTCFYK